MNSYYLQRLSGKVTFEMKLAAAQTKNHPPVSECSTIEQSADSTGTFYV